MIEQEDTISAIATPIGEGGISVIRISGPNAISIIDLKFLGKHKLSTVSTHTAHHGFFYGVAGTIIDEVVVTVFRSPHSYTSEDIVEISCHGGIFISKTILGEIITSGARMAQPGEFTKRAFINGKLDLSQAEAVADVIKASSDLSLQTSIQQLRGKISEEVIRIRDKILNICSLLELELDFSEEGIQLSERPITINMIKDVMNSIDSLVSTYKVGRIYRDGAKIVIVGKPNVGKSSILNNLLSEERSIVTNIPGTTRDVIQENLVINGVLFRIVDTAGLRKSEDVVEKSGIQRTEDQLNSADLVLFVIDSLEGFCTEDKEILDFIKSEKNISEDKTIVIYNKRDLLTGKDFNLKSKECFWKNYLYVSAKTGEGMNLLKSMLYDLALDEKLHSQHRGLTITNERHKISLLSAKNSLLKASNSAENEKSNEFLALDLRIAIKQLGEIIGEISTDDILNNIFSKFCIGK
jgi:tRNA modification GTPase